MCSSGSATAFREAPGRYQLWLYNRITVGCWLEEPSHPLPRGPEHKHSQRWAPEQLQHEGSSLLQELQAITQERD